MADTAYFCPLSHEGVLAVQGADASKFLQGQLTCNLNYLNDSTSSLGARCTPKGRMLSSFRILSLGDAYLLAMSRDLIEAQLADLQKYAVFSKSKLSDASDAWARLGLRGADAVLLSLGLDLAPASGSVAHANDLLAVRLRCKPNPCKPNWPRNCHKPPSTAGCWPRSAPASVRSLPAPASCSSRKCSTCRHWVP